MKGSAEARPRIPLSVDWEDWFQLCCPPYDEPQALDRFECRIPRATEQTLALCEALGAAATWFCLADQARRHPGLLRSIHAAGHRIGLHGLTHRRAFLSDRAAFRKDLETGRKVLEDILGAAVHGFRAPEWSLRGPAEDYWREVLEAGFRYDSSRAPLPYLGSWHWPREAHLLEQGFWECPPPVAGAGPARVPLWGWGMRTLPKHWLRARVQELARRRSGTPLVLHPWELDPAQPALDGCGLAHRFTHYAGLPGYAARLKWIWRDVPLVSIEAFLGIGA